MEVDNYAQLSSNDGRTSISLNARRTENDKTALAITVANCSQISSGCDDSHETKIPVVFCPFSAMTHLGNCMFKWLTNYRPVEFEIRCIDGQYCRFELCIDEDFVCSVDKPVFRFTYSEHRFAIESRFVVDQSCIRLFVEGIEKLG